MVIFLLPFPPSMNRYWRHYKGRMLLSRDGRAYKQKVARQLGEQMGDDQPSQARIKLVITAHPPDRRRRDLDNLLKGILDSLNGLVYDDDSQVDSLTIQRAEKVTGGLIRVLVEEM